MRKIHELRRAGVLLLTLGLGAMIGRIDSTWVVIGFITAFFMWVLLYDLVIEDQFKKERNRECRKQNY